MSETNVPKHIECKIIEFLLSLGISPALRGFRCACAGVRILLENPESGDQVTKVLYPAIAKEVGSTPSRVERSIRAAIERMLDKQSYTRCHELLGMYPNERSGKYTVSEFLHLCALRVWERERRNGSLQ